MHFGGHPTLDGSDQVRVDAHLQQGTALHATRQLGVRHLVVVRAQAGGTIDPEQEVRVAAPGSVEQRGLVDDIGALLHQVAGQLRVRFQPRSVVAVAIGPGVAPFDDGAALCLQVREIAKLVLLAAFAEHLQLLVDPVFAR